MQSDRSRKPIVSVQRLVSLTILMVLTGTGLELYLIDHYEDELQLIPLIIIALGLLLFTAHLWSRSDKLVKPLQLILIACGISGFLGTYFHLQANYEFEQEMRSGLPATELFWESLSGALPALAPMSMIVFTLLGFTYLLIIKKNYEKI